MLKIENLSVSYRDHLALENVSLEIPSSTITGIIAVSYTHLTLPTNREV